MFNICEICFSEYYLKVTQKMRNSEEYSQAALDSRKKIASDAWSYVNAVLVFLFKLQKHNGVRSNDLTEVYGNLPHNAEHAIG